MHKFTFGAGKVIEYIASILFFVDMKEFGYKHLTKSDMIRIETLLQEGYSNKDIGIKIGKDKTTIGRWRKKTKEILKNRDPETLQDSIECNILRMEEGENKEYINDRIEREKKQSGIYNAEYIWEVISERKSIANAHYRIVDDNVLSKYILTHIELHWSCEQIANTWSYQKGESLSKDTIYDWVYRNHPHLVKLYFRRKGKKYQQKRKEKYQIKNRKMIDERPETVENRLEIGHWEGDTIVGKDHQGAIVTNVERKTGFLIATLLEDSTKEQGRSEILADVTIQDFKKLPEEFCVSITYDNGKEFAQHEKIAKETAMTVYFAHPYSPWERGTNENTNGLLREFIPKGTDFSTITQKDLDYYVWLINNRPRKRLNWISPAQLFAQELQGCTSH